MIKLIIIIPVLLLDVIFTPYRMLVSLLLWKDLISRIDFEHVFFKLTIDFWKELNSDKK